LPKEIPQDIVDKSFDGMRHHYVNNDHLEVRCQGDRVDDHIIEKFANNERLMVWEKRILPENSWLLSVKWEQRIGRVDRIGQKNEVQAYNMLTNNSVDDRIYTIIVEKLDLIILSFNLICTINA